MSIELLCITCNLEDLRVVLGAILNVGNFLGRFYGQFLWEVRGKEILKFFFLFECTLGLLPVHKGK